MIFLSLFSIPIQSESSCCNFHILRHFLVLSNFSEVSCLFIERSCHTSDVSCLLLKNSYSSVLMNPLLILIFLSLRSCLLQKKVCFSRNTKIGNILAQNLFPVKSSKMIWSCTECCQCGTSNYGV